MKRIHVEVGREENTLSSLPITSFIDNTLGMQSVPLVATIKNILRQYFSRVVISDGRQIRPQYNSVVLTPDALILDGDVRRSYYNYYIHPSDAIKESHVIELAKKFPKWVYPLQSTNEEDASILRLLATSGENCQEVGIYLPKVNCLVVTEGWFYPHNYAFTASVLMDLDSFAILRTLIRPNPAEKDAKKSVSLGCDPEFEQLNEEGVVITPTVVNSQSTAIGRDGNAEIIEIRPKYAATPEALVKNTQYLIKQLPRVGVAGNCQPLGGHIHLGIPPHSVIIQALDHFLGEKFIHCNGEARGRYKELGEYRNQPHGFEYRSLPAVAFSNPRIMRIVLKLAQKIADTAYNSNFSYNYPPKKADYLQFLTPNEYSFFCKFTRNYGNGLIDSSNPINANWGVRGMELKFKENFRIIFEGRWSETTKAAIKEFLMPEIREINKRWKTEQCKPKFPPIRFLPLGDNKGEGSLLGIYYKANEIKTLMSNAKVSARFLNEYRFNGLPEILQIGVSRFLRSSSTTELAALGVGELPRLLAKEVVEVFEDYMKVPTESIHKLRTDSIKNQMRRREARRSEVDLYAALHSRRSLATNSGVVNNVVFNSWTEPEPSPQADPDENSADVEVEQANRTRGTYIIRDEFCNEDER